ncbi:MAG: hypothetical protein AB7R89_15105 [Dehalococcoidia bacterium]
MQLTIRLDPATYVALQDLALAERRRLRDQAAIVIRDGIRQIAPQGPTFLAGPDGD